MEAHERQTEREVATLLTVPETAARLGVSQATIRRRIKAGDLPAYAIARKQLIRPEDADALLRPVA